LSKKLFPFASIVGVQNAEEISHQKIGTHPPRLNNVAALYPFITSRKHSMYKTVQSIKQKKSLKNIGLRVNKLYTAYKSSRNLNHTEYILSYDITLY